MDSEFPQAIESRRFETISIVGLGNAINARTAMTIPIIAVLTRENGRHALVSYRAAIGKTDVDAQIHVKHRKLRAGGIQIVGGALNCGRRLNLESSQTLLRDHQPAAPNQIVCKILGDGPV